MQGRSYVEAMEAVASSLFGSYNLFIIITAKPFNILTFTFKRIFS